MNSIIYLATLLVALGAAAEPAATLQQTASPASTKSDRPYHRFGILLDGGVPDGFGVSVAFRPMHWLRLELGALENTVSPGIRGGVTLRPFNFWITPTLTVDGGHYFTGNANTIVRRFASNLGTDKAILDQFNYDFVNAHLGFEIGSKVFAFYVRVGESYVSTTLRNTQQFLQQESNSNVNIEAKNINASYRGPSAKLGFAIYFM